ncbi:MAG: hypothetical protein AAB660_02090 [Patescibacteria group bacterium]
MPPIRASGDDQQLLRTMLEERGVSLVLTSPAIFFAENGRVYLNLPPFHGMDVADMKVFADEFMRRSACT